jgi:hypothetical protein
LDNTTQRVILNLFQDLSVLLSQFAIYNFQFSISNSHFFTPFPWNTNILTSLFPSLSPYGSPSASLAATCQQ